MLEKQPGRPLGPIAEAILELLAEKGPLTAREIADSLQLANGTAKVTCTRLEIRKKIRVVARVRLQGVNKPVSKYALVRSIQKQTTISTAFFRI